MKRLNISKAAATILMLSCATLSVQGEQLNPQGLSVEDIVPAGWLHQEASGDLNKDGIADLVIIATPDDAENLKTRDDGYVYNFNQPVLAIYFGNAQGQFQQWKQYDNVIPADDSEFCHHDIVLTITDRNTLRIATELWCSAGSYGASTDTYTFRYQNGDFYLIGMDHEEIQRNTGECVTTSENYLTWKRQVLTSNFTNTKPPKEKWSKLSKKPLEHLGDREL